MGEKTLDIVELMEVLKKRVRIIIICTLAFTLLASIIVTFKMKPISSAATKVYISETENLQFNYNDKLKEYSNSLKAYVEMIRMNGFMEKAIEDGKIDVSVGELNSGLAFHISETIPVITVTYNSSTAERAANILSAFIEQFQKGVKESMPSIHTGILQDVTSSTSYPNKVKVVIVGLIVGLVSGIGLVLVLDYLDNTISKKEDLEELLSIPALETLPLEIDEVDKNNMFAAKESPKSLLAEAYRGLRTSLEYSSVDKKLKSIVITSTEPGEGKSTVAGNLAFTLAQGEKKVILIDCDLRKPSLHKKLRLSNEIGLTDYLVGKCELNKAIYRLDKNIDIITSGKKAPNPAEIIYSKGMENLIESLKEAYDYVIIDTPPVKTINDGVVLGAKTDGTIYVVRADKTKEQDVVKGYKELEKVRANVIGSVLNGASNGKDSYYYYYYQEQES